MKADQWPGLVTNASPYAIPLGAAVEQTNLVCTTPGQIVSRDGMRKVACVGATPALLDCYPYEANGKTYLISLTAAGQLVAFESPAYGVETARPAEPSLAATGSQVATSYTYRYATSSTPAGQPEPPPPVETLDSLDGGNSALLVAPLYVADAMNLCSGSGKLAEIDGGSAADSFVTPTVPATSLCSL
jgi:hypothetical protein